LGFRATLSIRATRFSESLTHLAVSIFSRLGRRLARDSARYFGQASLPPLAWRRVTGRTPEYWETPGARTGLLNPSRGDLESHFLHRGLRFGILHERIPYKTGAMILCHQHGDTEVNSQHVRVIPAS